MLIYKNAIQYFAVFEGVRYSFINSKGTSVNHTFDLFIYTCIYLQASESQEEAVDTILSVTDRLFSSVGDAHEMVKQARQLAQATSMLVNTIRGQAESHPDSDVQKRLLAAAKALADATAKMVEAAKVSTS